MRNMLLTFVGQIGRSTIQQLADMGRMFLFLLSAFAWAVRPPQRLRLIIFHIRSIGVESLSVVLLSGVFTGMVMGLQGYYSLRKFNAESFLGSAVALGLLRELGPVLSAFMVTGRTGSAMADPVLPVTMKAERTGPSSRSKPSATAEPRKLSA